jgi:ribonucleoside-diphosphate reductase beta chain
MSLTRARAFAAVDNIPSIAKKARFCQRWIDQVAVQGEVAFDQAF